LLCSPPHSLCAPNQLTSPSWHKSNPGEIQGPNNSLALVLSVSFDIKSIGDSAE